MRLRLRLLLTTLAVAAPLVLALGFVSLQSARADFDHRLVEFVLTQMLSGERGRCERDASTWVLQGDRPPGFGPFDHPDHGGPGDHGPPPGEPPDGHRHGPGGPGGPGAPSAYGYDADLHSQNPRAPQLSAELRADRDAAPTAASWSARSGDKQLLVKMPWQTGPCAYVLAVPGGAGGPRLGLPPLDLWLPPVVAVCLALMVSVGSVVRRVRRLTQEVEASTQQGYGLSVTVEGADEISALAGAFARASKEIRLHLETQAQRETSLREFLANTTHDVMIPLTVLQGHLARFESAAAKQEVAAPQEVRAAMDEAHYMASLIHNLGLAARLEAGPARMDLPVDLNAVVARVISRYTQLARQHDLSLDSGTPPEPVMTPGDVTMIEQAVSNLVYNALRYNKPGGHVAVVLEQTGERFQLRVIDDGPGVPADQIGRLVERGFRTDAARSRAPGGQGLGLSIAREVARQHHFTFELQSPPEGGLTVALDGACGPQKLPGSPLATI